MGCLNNLRLDWYRSYNVVQFVHLICMFLQVFNKWLWFVNEPIIVLNIKDAVSGARDNYFFCKLYFLKVNATNEFEFYNLVNLFYATSSRVHTVHNNLG